MTLVTVGVVAIIWPELLRLHRNTRKLRAAPGPTILTMFLLSFLNRTRHCDLAMCTCCYWSPSHNANSSYGPRYPLASPQLLHGGQEGPSGSSLIACLPWFAINVEVSCAAETHAPICKQLQPNWKVCRKQVLTGMHALHGRHFRRHFRKTSTCLSQESVHCSRISCRSEPFAVCACWMTPGQRYHMRIGCAVPVWLRVPVDQNHCTHAASETVVAC